MDNNDISKVVDTGAVYHSERGALYGQYSINIYDDDGVVVDSVTAPMNTITRGFQSLMTLAIFGEASKVTYGGHVVPAADPITGGSRVEFTSHGLSNQMPYTDVTNGTRDMKSLGIYFDTNTSENYRHDRMSNLPFRSTNTQSAGTGTVADTVRQQVDHFNNTQITTSVSSVDNRVFRITKRFKNISGGALTPINIYLMARGGANAYMSTNENEAGRRRHNNHLIVAMEHLQGNRRKSVPNQQDFDITFTFFMDDIFFNPRRFMMLCLGHERGYTRTDNITTGWRRIGSSTPRNCQMPIHLLLGGSNANSNNDTFLGHVFVSTGTAQRNPDTNWEVHLPSQVEYGNVEIEYSGWEGPPYGSHERYRSVIRGTITNISTTAQTMTDTGILRRYNFAHATSPSTMFDRDVHLTYRELINPPLVLAPGDSVDVQFTLVFHCLHHLHVICDKCDLFVEACDCGGDTHTPCNNPNCTIPNCPGGCDSGHI